ncbi:phage tail-collar fiber domain-containing protein [Acinetobacter sp. PC34]|uniref:phage tail-collar fiber domain-containing protein n=1 Tax=Acinetobacter sp. PC34 TaxID=3453032 RepID=UPI003F6A7017
MNYKTIYTALGLALVSQAVSQQRTIELTHFAVGDGGGNAMIPNESMIQLIREKYRATINRIYQDPENENKYTAEMIIPVTVEGFVVREIALFDRNGNMVLVGNTPEVHKPTLAEGVTQDSVYRIPFVISNPEVLELNFDPNVIIATHQWILNTLTPANMFPGGTNGQVLKKKSNADGDTEWADAGSAEVFVNTIEEEQSLVADQLIVDLSTTTTTGAAVYINGDRITNRAGADGWLATTATRITLGKAYPGAKILIVQNEPLGAAPYPLAQKNNFSDVLNKPLARQNLGVMSADEAKFNDCPPGTVVMLASQNIPTGYRLLKCNGATISRTAYADLFSVIGTTFGSGDGVNTFRLPDLRGEFLRGWDDGRGIDSGRAFGSWQPDDFKSHSHKVLDSSAVGTNMGVFHYGERGGYNNQDYNEVSSSGGVETRPRNFAMLTCIRY